MLTRLSKEVDEDNEFKARAGANIVEGTSVGVSKKYDLSDFELGAKITGAGFPVYKGAGAILQRAYRF